MRSTMFCFSGLSYVWDESFATDYTRLDEEHDVLFAQILAVSQAPDSNEKLATMKDSMRKHFDYEQQRFCSVPSYNCVDHKMKHYKFGSSWMISTFLLTVRRSTGPRTGWHSTSRTLTMGTSRDCLGLTLGKTSQDHFPEKN